MLPFLTTASAKSSVNRGEDAVMIIVLAAKNLVSSANHTKSLKLANPTFGKSMARMEVLLKPKISLLLTLTVRP
jgi:hypothetical protein